MFNAQRILGALVSDGVDGGGFRDSRRRRRHREDDGIGAGTLLAGAAGVAAAGGLAYMAYQHFKQPAAPPMPGAPGMHGMHGAPGMQAMPGAPAQQGFFGQLMGASSGPVAPGAPPGGGTNFGVPVYHNDPSTWGTSAPAAPAQGHAPWGGPPPGQPAAPPAPPAQWGAPPNPVAPAPVPAPAPAADTQADAMLLIRAMITAAFIDGHIDADERARILDRVARAGLGPEDQAALARELEAPQPPFALVGQIRSPQMAEQFYVVSLLSAGTESEAERSYLKGLPSMLGLRPDVVARLHSGLGIPPLP